MPGVSMSRQSIFVPRQSLALDKELYVVTKYVYRDRVQAKDRRFLVATI